MTHGGRSRRLHLDGRRMFCNSSFVESQPRPSFAAEMGIIWNRLARFAERFRSLPVEDLCVC